MVFISRERRAWQSVGHRLLSLCFAAVIAQPPIAAAQSLITTRPDDPAGVLVTADGIDEGDDTAAIQAAVDKAGAAFSGGIGMQGWMRRAGAGRTIWMRMD